MSDFYCVTLRNIRWHKILLRPRDFRLTTCNHERIFLACLWTMNPRRLDTCFLYKNIGILEYWKNSLRSRVCFIAFLIYILSEPWPTPFRNFHFRTQNQLKLRKSPKLTYYVHLIIKIAKGSESFAYYWETCYAILMLIWLTLLQKSRQLWSILHKLGRAGRKHSRQLLIAKFV